MSPGAGPTPRGHSGPVGDGIFLHLLLPVVAGALRRHKARATVSGTGAPPAALPRGASGRRPAVAEGAERDVRSRREHGKGVCFMTDILSEARANTWVRTHTPGAPGHPVSTPSPEGLTRRGFSANSPCSCPASEGPSQCSQPGSAHPWEFPLATARQSRHSGSRVPGAKCHL